VIVVDDRIIIADIKDWHGVITSEWRSMVPEMNRNIDTSPVKKILKTPRIMKGLLSGFLQKTAAKSGTKFNAWEMPLIEGCVVLTGALQQRRHRELEKPRVFQIDEFCRVVKNGRERSKRFARAKMD